jgi:hypothetical protein
MACEHVIEEAFQEREPGQKLPEATACASPSAAIPSVKTEEQFQHAQRLNAMHHTQLHILRVRHRWTEIIPLEMGHPRVRLMILASFVLHLSCFGPNR